jgi:hypothetical protein
VQRTSPRIHRTIEGRRDLELQRLGAAYRFEWLDDTPVCAKRSATDPAIDPL